MSRRRSGRLRHFLAGICNREAKTCRRPGWRIRGDGVFGCLARLGTGIRPAQDGDPPRLAEESIDFSAFIEQTGDEEPMDFSYLNEI